MLSLEDAVKEFGRPVVLKALKAEYAKRNLAYFVEQTSGYKLHPWQRILCKRIELMRGQKGQRILCHAPPQTGKSQIVSKRAPVWRLLNNPTTREVLVCYNQTKAASFAWANKLVTEGEFFREHFKDFSFEKYSEDGGWTKERLLLADSQPSLMGVGLSSGFTGNNADTLTWDDPYANAEEARSEAANRSVRSFWEDTAEPRLMANPDANVFVMFHRYHDQDIAGYLKTKIEWECLTFPAIANGDSDDPTGREIGELLSSFHTLEGLRKKEEEDPRAFYGQFQGSPLKEGVKVYQPEWFEDKYIEPHECPPLTTWYRGVDTAVSDKSYADHTGSVRLAFDQHGNLYLRGFAKKRVAAADIPDWMEQVAGSEAQGQTWVCEAVDAGYAVVDRLRRLGFPVHAQQVKGKGSKLQRAFPLATLAQARKVYIVKEGDWQSFCAELWAFTGDPKLKESDDLHDAVTIVLLYLKENPSRPIQTEHEKQATANLKKLHARLRK